MYHNDLMLFTHDIAITVWLLRTQTRPHASHLGYVAWRVSPEGLNPVTICSLERKDIRN